MADYTQNYNLKKPAQNDFYNIDDFNDNADIIDEALSDKLNSDFSNVSGGAVPISNGDTGAITASDARSNLGLGTSNTPTFNAVNLTNATVNGKNIYNSGSNMTDLQREICANNKGFFVCQNWWANTGFTSDVNTWINTGVYNMIGSEVTNVPTDTDGWGTIAVFQCDKSVIQFAHFWNANTFYARKGGYDSNTQSYIFNDWQRIGSPYVQKSQPNNAPNNSLWAW